MDVVLPQSNNQTAATVVLNISITRNLEYFVNEKPCNLAEMELQMKALISDASDPPIVRLNADENLNMNEIYDFLEIARRNSLRVILGTRPI